MRPAGQRASEPTRTGEFEAFFDREAAGQVRRATLLLGSVDDANDVVQEALTRIYRRWDDLDEPGPYLNRAVLNLCRDHARRERTRWRLTARLTARSPTAAPEDPLDDLLGGLPFNQRAAVVLRFWGGLSTTEIAAELGCAPGSVGPWISRALRTMREDLT